MDVERLLDPELAAALALFPRELGTLSAETLERVRGLEYPAPPLSDDVERTDVVVPGPPGAPEVTIRVHRPVGDDGTMPALVWAHGGGYVLGTYTSEDFRFDRWCTRFRCLGVSIEYRLAPETPYPGPLEDCYAALRWVHANASGLDVDPDRIGIGGISAGGGLAAALALLARDRGEVPVAFQCLLYPMIDDRLANASHDWEVPVWPPSCNRFGWASYLGDRSGDDVPAHAAPARATDLAGLPPAIVVVGALDGFLDEDVDYALRLNRAGVATELHVYPGACHGFDAIAPTTPVAGRARRDIEEWLGRALGPAVSG
jgi:acetyl esterase/lipase